MKKFALIILSMFLFQISNFADVYVYSDRNKFGLKDSQNNIITKAKYKKLVRLGETSWIMQVGSNFGIVDDQGNILTEPKYNQAERLVGKYVKFRKGSKYCLLDQNGNDILGSNSDNDKKIKMYSSIDLLYGGLIVTANNHKYGLSSFNKTIQLDNIFDDIYMTDNDSIVLIYGGKKMEFKRLEKNPDNVPFNFVFVDLENNDIRLSDLANSPLATTGYYGITFTDYVLKLFSSISPAYEQTIDELMFSQGADSVSVLMKCTWLPKFPFTYAKNYYSTVTDPLNGPLNKAKKNIRQRIKD